MAVEIYSNQATTTVPAGGTTAPASGTVESWTVASSSSFPAADSDGTPPTQFHVADVAASKTGELILVTNVSGTTWTVTRGAEGTTPVAHAAGFTIWQVVSAGAYQQLASVDWLNVVTQFGADPTGVADSTTAINNALAGTSQYGPAVYLPAGQYLINGSAALALIRKGTMLAGDGPWATQIIIGSGFTGTELIDIQQPGCTVRDIQIAGSSGTVSANAACTGIALEPGAFRVTLTNLDFINVNGWCITSTNANGFDDNSGAIFHAINTTNCAGGCMLSGNSSAIGTVISDCGFDGSNTSANLDGFLILDADDVTCTNVNVTAGSGGTGHGLHIKGACQNIWLTIMDNGGYPEPLASTQCGVLIETSSNGHPNGVHISHAVFQTFGIGGQVSGASSQVYFDDVWFNNNLTHGLYLPGSGAQVVVESCIFEQNGQIASGTNYDLNISGSPDGWVRNCHFLSAIVASSSPGVQFAAQCSGGNIPFDYCEFLGANSGLATIFSGLPSRVRQCKNYNPHGSITVTVPASASASAALHYDAWFYVTAADVSYSFTATDASPCVFMAAGSSYANGNPVVLTGASLPTGFTGGTTYYVVSASTDTFELAATSGGTAINSTSTGSGTVTGACLIVRNTNGQGGGVGPAVTIPPGQCVPVFVGAQTNITPTYGAGNAPTWVVDGL